MNTDKEMNTAKEVKPKKRIFAKIASELPYILLGIGVFFLTFSTLYGLSKGVQYEMQAKALTTENAYLKEEIEWFKAQLSDVHCETPAVTDGAETTAANGR